MSLVGVSVGPGVLEPALSGVTEAAARVVAGVAVKEDSGVASGVVGETLVAVVVAVSRGEEIGLAVGVATEPFVEVAAKVGVILGVDVGVFKGEAVSVATGVVARHSVFRKFAMVRGSIGERIPSPRKSGESFTS